MASSVRLFAFRWREIDDSLGTAMGIAVVTGVSLDDVLVSGVVATVTSTAAGDLEICKAPVMINQKVMFIFLS